MKHKLLLFLFSLTFLFHSAALPSLATTVPTVAPGRWYSPSLGEFIQKVQFSPEQEIFGERYTYAQVVWILHSFSSIMQFDITSPDSREAVKNIFDAYLQGQSPNFANFSRLGAPGILLGSISEIYNNPPASGIQYVAQGLEKFNLATPAFAQGYGFDNNTIVLPLWAASRNLCYFLMVVLLIAAGFMIMFRIKVNPQTAVSIQVMIPKIIITLVLITFSYAIAGFIIDLVYLSLTLIISALSLTGVINDLGQAVSFYTGGFSNIFFYYFFSQMLFIYYLAGLFSGPTMGFSVIITLVISIVLLIMLIKVFWMLITTYISLMIGFITAPWHILLGLIPASKGGFGPWLRGMIANASVFVVIPLMFLFAAYIAVNPAEWLVQITSGGFPVQIFEAITDWVTFDSTGVAIPPNNSRAIALPLFGFGSNMGIFMGFIASLAILSLTPKIALMIKDSLKVSAFKYGSAFGEALSPVTSPVGGALMASGKQLSERPSSGPFSYIINKLGGGSLQGLGQVIQKK